jgi:hypothetical protein
LREKNRSVAPSATSVSVLLSWRRGLGRVDRPPELLFQILQIVDVQFFQITIPDRFHDSFLGVLVVFFSVFHIVPNLLLLQLNIRCGLLHIALLNAHLISHKIELIEIVLIYRDLNHVEVGAPDRPGFHLLENLDELDLVGPGRQRRREGLAAALDGGFEVVHLFLTGEDGALDVAWVGDAEENDAAADVAETADVLTDTIQLHLTCHILPLLELVMMILDLLSAHIKDIVSRLPIFELMMRKRLLPIPLVRERVRRAAFDGHERVK